MRKQFTIVAAASMALGVSTLVPLSHADDVQKPPGQGDAAIQAALPPLQVPAGTKVVQNVKAEDMYEVLAQVTEAALTKGGLDDIVERLVDMDRNRIGKFAEQSFQTLDGRIDQLQKSWQGKYNQKFDLDARTVFANAQAVEGEIERPVVLLSNWPVEPTPGHKDLGNQEGQSKVLNEQVKEQGNIKAGREVGIVRIPAEFGLPALDVSLIDEAGGWKIDIPDTRTGQQIHDDLLKHLTLLGESGATWPADRATAERLFAHHVLMALYGIDTPRQSDPLK